MKKRLLTVAAVCAAAVCFGACKPASDDGYGALNEMLRLSYSQIDLTITDDFGEGAVLKSEYTMKPTDGGVLVSYSVERFNTIASDLNAEDIKSAHTGEALVKGEEVTYLSGEEVALPEGFAAEGLHFEKDYFGNADLTGNYLKTDVRNAGGFMGSELNCTDMKVFATFLEAFYDIEITYVGAAGNAVKYEYAFHL